MCVCEAAAAWDVQCLPNHGACLAQLAYGYPTSLSATNQPTSPSCAWGVEYATETLPTHWPPPNQPNPCPPSPLRQVEEDPTGGKYATETGVLGGAPNKLQAMSSFHVGEAVMALQRAVLQPGGRELIVYGTINGAIGEEQRAWVVRLGSSADAVQLGGGGVGRVAMFTAAS